MTNPDLEKLASELVRLAVKDHDEGGYAFAGMYEILEHRIAKAFQRVRADALEEAAMSVQSMAGGAYQFGVKDHYELLTKVAAAIRALAGRG